MCLSTAAKVKDQWSDVSVVVMLFDGERGLQGKYTVQIIKVLGEGGFSFVYLAQDEHSGVRIRLLFDISN